MFRLRRLTDKPILSPVKEHEWERKAVFNAASIYEDHKFHLFYRASNNGFVLNTEKPEEKHKFVSSIGYAVSSDGINFERFDKPIMVGETEQEEWGVEDPRITKIDDKYYMLYTGFGGKDWNNFRICMATSYDLKRWEGHRVVLDEPNKDAALLPEKINGKYVMFHRREPDIWIAYSDDLVNWTDHKIIMTPISGTWESKKIGIAGPPIKREDGWLLIYHGVDENNVYRLGAALVDLDDPSKVIARQEEPILEPELDWEKEGLVPNVVFSCGAVEVNEKYYVYYGGADTHIGVAVVEKNKISF
ncbi:glycoside hydrolase family 130 protein [Thermoanaerobacterium thermosaccharolyticum]|uniref:glycoside hydrolase family 130 protein n=1 Tax=Thermoanaerobacterium thermosaccharolyticum TaxID=1517 RepID=UPI00123A5F79|nr:glycosidase [Thermoanaerobacterium thermosaccharolyticum]KAA5807955.1 glycosidase [Thermoanaerobacterium thermosaccharolyticum]